MLTSPCGNMQILKANSDGPNNILDMIPSAAVNMNGTALANVEVVGR